MAHSTTPALAASALLALAGGCAPAAVPRDAPAPLGAEAPREADAAPMPSPRRGRGEDAVAKSRECERCHADVAAEQRASQHSSAHDDAVYLRAFALEPVAFCTGCHAPEAPAGGPVTAGEGALGVGCVTCHVTGSGDILAAPLVRGAAASAPGDSASAPHAVIRDARFSSSDACASCHEFEFPDSALRRTPELMQSTVSEHHASPAAEEPCAECHMPRSGRRRSHVFPASRDEAFVLRAAIVRAERLSASVVRVTLSPGAVGHAFPTGDLFRRVEVLAQVVGPEMSLAREEARYLARHFDDVRAGPARSRVLAKDDRVAPGAAPRVVDIDLGPEAAGRDIAFHVAYQRVQNTRSVDDRDAPLDGEIVLAQGTLSP